MKIESMKEMMIRLAEMNTCDAPVLSCFVDLKHNPGSAIEVIEQQAMESSRTLDAHQKRCFNEALTQIKRHLNDSSLPDIGGIAIYARAGDEPLFLTYSTGVPFETELIVDSLPHLYPLVETRDTYHRFFTN